RPGATAGHGPARSYTRGMADELISFARGAPSADILPVEPVREAAQRVIVEQPSYDRTLLLLERLGAERVGVGLEADGIDVHELEQEVGRFPVGLAHVIPNFHNPAGCTLSAPKRERLVELAAEHGFRIFEDDPYQELFFEEAPPPTMLSLDGADR